MFSIFFTAKMIIYLVAVIIATHQVSLAALITIAVPMPGLAEVFLCAAVPVIVSASAVAVVLRCWRSGINCCCW